MPSSRSIRLGGMLGFALLSGVACQVSPPMIQPQPDGGVDPRPEPLAGDEPFSRILTGTIDLAGISESKEVKQTRTYSMQIFFPKGRRPGAPYWIANMPGTSGRYLDVKHGILDAKSGVEKISMCVDERCCGYLEEGTLEGPSGGLRGKFSHRLYCGTDVSNSIEGEGRLESHGQEAPLGVISISDAPIVPTGRIWMSLSTPIATKDRPVVTAGGQQLAGTMQLTESSMSWTPDRPFPPEQPISISADGFKDVLGRPVSLNARVPTAMVTESLNDLSLKESPGAGALVGFEWGGDALDGRAGNPGGPGSFSGMLRLNVPPESSQLQVLIFERFCSSHPHLGAAVVAADGTNTDIPVHCGETDAPDVVELPASGTVWLSVHTINAWYGEVTLRDLAILP